MQCHRCLSCLKMHSLSVRTHILLNENIINNIMDHSPINSTKANLISRISSLASIPYRLGEQMSGRFRWVQCHIFVTKHLKPLHCVCISHSNTLLLLNIPCSVVFMAKNGTQCFTYVRGVAMLPTDTVSINTKDTSLYIP